MTNPTRNFTGTLCTGAIALATAAAAAFLAAPMAAAAADDAGTVGHCMGANACKGRSSCRTEHHGCRGQNACKGQGFVDLTRAQCEQVGGVFEAVK